MTSPGYKIALMDGMGLSEFCLTFDRFSPEALIGCFDALLDQKKSVSKKISTTVQVYRRALDEQYRVILQPQEIS